MGARQTQRQKKPIEFMIAHDCVPVADMLDLKVRVTDPNKNITDSPKLPHAGSSIAEVVLPWLVNKPDQWSFQVIATSGGMVRPVGKPQTLMFVSGPWWEQYGRFWPASSR
jgi:hypothetical protein